MDKPITVSYRWSADEMLLINRLHMSYSVQGRKLNRGFRSTGVILLCMGIVSLCDIALTPQKLHALTFGLGFVSAAAALLVGMPRLLRNAVVKSYAKKPDKDLVVTYELSEQHLSCKSEVASSELHWRTVLRALRTRDGFLLYLSETPIHWLPVHGFQDPSDVDRFAELAKAEVKDYKHER